MREPPPPHIPASTDGRVTWLELCAGVLAMEALHRQVLPFLLRRMKEDVLQDLPPKIIQDYYCTLSPLQVRPHNMKTGPKRPTNDVRDVE